MQSTIFEGWYAAEVAKLFSQEPTDRPGILLACPVWGDTYVKRLSKYTLPSLMAPANMAALRKHGHLIVLYTDDIVHLWRCMFVFELAGLNIVIREIPKQVLEATTGVNKYQLLGTVQGIALQWAARTGRAIHMFQPDHTYGPRYFESMFRLGKKHEALAQGGVSINLETAEADIEAFRKPGGYLEIPDRDLGDLAWKHLHPQSRVALAHSEGFALHNVVIWKGKDALHIANPLLNSAYLSPRLCREAPVLVPATLDGEAPALMPGEWHIPTPDEGMSFAELSDSKKAAPAKTDFAGFAGLCWVQMNMSDAYLPFWRRRTLVPTSHDAEGLDVDYIDEMHKAIVDGVIGLKKAAMEAYFANLIVRRLRRFGKAPPPPQLHRG